MDLDSLQCFMCLEFVPENHYTCQSNGKHKVCITCKKSDLCEICKFKMDEVNDASVNEVYIRFNATRRCIHKHCDAAIEQKDYTDHTSNCYYAPIECPNLNCDHMFEYNADMSQHLRHLSLVHKLSTGTAKIKISRIGVRKAECKIHDLFQTHVFQLSRNMYTMVHVEQNQFKNEYLSNIGSEIIISLYCTTNDDSKEEYEVKFGNVNYKIKEADSYIKSIRAPVDLESFKLTFTVE